MENKVNKLKKGCGIALLVYLLSAALFLWLANEQITYTQDSEMSVGSAMNKNVDEIVDGDVFVQTARVESDFVSAVRLAFQTYGRADCKGTFLVELVNPENDQVIAQGSLDAAEIADNAWTEVSFGGRVSTEGLKDGNVRIQVTNQGGAVGTTVTLCIEENFDDSRYTFYINGEQSADTALCVSLVGSNYSPFSGVYLPLLIAGFAVLALYCAAMIRAERKEKENFGLHFIHVFQKYRFLIEQLVSRDFKTKYKRSVLGIFWSFLNPLLTMGVQYVVFSQLFRFEIPNYAVYLLTGIVLYSSFSDTTTQAMSSITGNASLITKVYVPKYIYPISKVLSTTINLLLSLIPMLIVALFTGIRISPALLLTPYMLVTFVLFMIGMAFILSSAMVFFRDMQFLWGVFTMMWMYATPIMYPISQLPEWLQKLEMFNPMYHYINFFRIILIDGTSPEPMLYVVCAAFALFTLAVGGFIFKKTQDKFVLYI